MNIAGISGHRCPLIEMVFTQFPSAIIGSLDIVFGEIDR